MSAHVVCYFLFYVFDKFDQYFTKSNDVAFFVIVTEKN